MHFLLGNLTLIHSTPRSIVFAPNRIELLKSLLEEMTEPSPVPYAQLVDEIQTVYLKRHINTRIKMRQALREFGDLLPEPKSTLDISPQLVERFASRPGRASTSNGLLGRLRIALKYGEDMGYLKPGTVAKSKFHISDRDPIRSKHHSMDSVAKVLAYLESKAEDWQGERLLAFARILAYCGLRPGEALRLESADLKDGFLFVRPHGHDLKTSASQAPVPVPRSVLPSLENWACRCGSQWMLPTFSRKKPWTNGPTHYRAGTILKKAAEEIGVEGFTPYSLRHSLATHLMGYQGLTPSQVKMILRHSNQYAQKFYIHADLANLKRAVEGFDYARALPSP